MSIDISLAVPISDPAAAASADGGAGGEGASLGALTSLSPFGSPATKPPSQATPHHVTLNPTEPKGQGELLSSPSTAPVIPVMASTRKSMLRQRNESALKTVERMRMHFSNMKADVIKIRKTREQVLASCPSAEVLGEDGEPLDLNQTNDEVWQKATAIRVGGNTIIPVRYNVPTVTNVQPPSSIYVGVPCVCSGIVLLFAKKGDLRCEWILPAVKQRRPASRQNAPPKSQVQLQAPERHEDDELVGTSMVLYPTQEMIGRSLIFRCRPDVEDSLWTEVETPKVSEADSRFLPMPRWSKLVKRNPAPTNNELRLVTYNVLHDAFCTSRHAKTKIYPFAKEEILDLGYRRCRIMQEIKQYEADLMCFQECGSDVYQRYYHDVLAAYGFESLLTMKTGSVKEGCMTAYRQSRLKLLHSESLPLSLATLSDRHSTIADSIQKYPHLTEALANVPSVGWLGVFEDLRTQAKFVATNTHLYFHGNGCHIRAIQTYMLAHRAYELQQAHGNCALVMLGDFNASRKAAGYTLLTTGSVPADNYAWERGMNFWWGIASGLGVKTKRNETDAASNNDDDQDDEDDEENDDDDDDNDDDDTPSEPDAPKVTDETVFSKLGKPTDFWSSELQLPFVLKDTHADDPSVKFTNYCLGFKDVIDHIFVSDEFSVVRTLPIPSESELEQDIALPSKKYPSDHLALVADVAIRGEKKD